MFEVVPIPAFEDNYIWLLKQGRHAVVVDPGEADPVLDYLAQQQLTLSAILCTHHHGDHVGGNRELLAAHAVPVYGPAHEKIPGRTQAVRQGDRVALPELDVTFDVLDVPGHTAGHVAYYGAGSLFCGDTLFACGCGRLFEGTPLQMADSLARIAALPRDTRIYCAHEYTLANIRFARVVDPNNRELVQREARDRASREKHRPTLPSTLDLELRTNPFLRCNEPAIREAAAQRAGHPLADNVAVFAEIRSWKNTFR